jgi:hypothetical protein
MRQQQQQTPGPIDVGRVTLPAVVTGSNHLVPSRQHHDAQRQALLVPKQTPQQPRDCRRLEGLS